MLTDMYFTLTIPTSLQLLKMACECICFEIGSHYVAVHAGLELTI